MKKEYTNEELGKLIKQLCSFCDKNTERHLSFGYQNKLYELKRMDRRKERIFK